MSLAHRATILSPSLTLAIDSKAKAMKAEGIDVCSFGAGEPDFDTPGPAAQAGIQAIQRGLTHYPPNPGIPELRAAIAGNLSRLSGGRPVDPARVIVSSGSKQSIFNAAFCLWGPKDKVLIPSLLAPFLGIALAAALMIVITWLIFRQAPGRMNVLFRRLQLASGGFVAFTHGTNDAQKTMGIITLALIASGHLPADEFDVPVWVIFSAATAMVIVECVALAIMVSNHIVMPLVLQRSTASPADSQNVGGFLLKIRRVAIFGILLLAYFYYRQSGDAQLASIGLLSFAAVAQFAPAFFGGLFWRRGTTAISSDEPVETVDIMPTLAAMLGFSIQPGSIDGKCLTGTGVACPR